MFDVPTNAPAVVATESASKARSICSTSPSSLTFPVKLATLVSVPAVSKKSTNKKANATPINPAVNNALKSILNACSGLGIAPATPPRSLSPVTQAIILTARTPRIIAPGILRLSSIAIITKPSPVRITGQLVTSPKPTSVAGLSTTTPAFFKPMIARNKPIPAPTPSFILLGILLIIYLRAGVTLSPINTTPATNTAASAC